MPRRSAMFKTCCGDCGECWYVGNPRTCTCPDETTKRTWVGLTDEEIMQVCSQIKPFDDTTIEQAFIEFARAVLKKASEK